MKAIVIVQQEGEQRPTLEYQTVEEPICQPTELLVAVKTAGINRIDLARSTAHGGPSAGKPMIAGLEMAGEVIAIGSEVAGFELGDRVMGMTTGAYAQIAAIDYRVAMRMPAAFSYDQAAAVATVFPTAHNALVTNGQFAPGMRVLIQGVGSAVGIATLQIAKAMGAATVIGVGRPHTKTAELKALGLDYFLDRESQDIAIEVLRLTDGKGVDVVIDMVGGTALADNLEAVALAGRIVNVGWMGGSKDEIDLDKLARKRISLIGVSFRTRTPEQKAALFSQFRRDTFPLFERGTLRPIIQATYPLAEALKAQDSMALDQHLGKILLHP